MKKIHDFDEVFDAQKLFRLILTAVSNPGKTVDIKEFSEKMYGASPAFLALAMTLLDNEVSFAVCGDDTLEDDIISLTLARSTEPGDADFIFVTDAALLGKAVGGAKCGTLRDPHRSATVVAAAGDSDDAFLRLTGPGIRDVCELHVPSAVADALVLRDKQFYEYPQGIDFIFISAGGLFAIPRLTRREV